jgi:hypothetical protein
LKVRRGADVRARDGFFVTAPGQQKSEQRMDLQMAVASPLD